MSRGAGRGNVWIDNNTDNPIPTSVVGTASITGAVGWIDQNGTARQYQAIDKYPMVVAQDYGYAISEGEILNHAPFTLNGLNNTVGATEETIWLNSTLYSFPTSAGQLEILSSDANDNATGTGARTARIIYLKSDYSQSYVDFTLNGVTPVSSGLSHADIWRVNGFYVLTVGSSGYPVGNLTVRYAGGGATQAHIIAGNTLARRAIYTVPAGKNIYITGFTASIAGTKYGVVKILASASPVDGTKSTLLYPAFEIALLNSVFTNQFAIPRRIRETIDVMVTVRAEAAGSLCTCNLTGWLESN